jgi:signal transduction histidine kinase
MPSLVPGEQVPLVTPFRWGALAVAATLASPRLASASWPTLTWFAVLPGYAAWRTLRPLRFGSGARAVVNVSAEVAINAAAVATTGYWSSPFVFCLLTAIIAAGFTGSFRFAVRIAVASAVCVAAPHVVLAGSVTASDLSENGQWTAMLVLVSMVAGYARRITAESVARQTEAANRLGRLAEANELLHSLHQMTQSLPASLDIDEVLDSATSRLHELLAIDALTVLLREPATEQWIPIRREGNRDQGPLTTADLPGPLAQAVRGDRVISIGVSGPGANLAHDMNSGIYAPLRARGALVGLLAVEARERHRFTERDAEVVSGLLESLALAIDNAQSFSRLRTVGAEEERTRIARDLHDRIGQSLAYLGFELDRAVRTAQRGDDVIGSLETLRGDVRSVIREVRDTLYDLRTDVSEGQGIGVTMGAYLERVAERSGLAVTVRADEVERIPLPIERELWRIAKEAITNVERHAKATELAVSWVVGPQRVELVVSDNGIGISGRGRVDSYGVIGMRERAASIDARLSFETNPSGGTTVRVELPRTPEV